MFFGSLAALEQENQLLLAYFKEKLPKNQTCAFFFQLDNASLSDPAALWRTIAWNLASKRPIFIDTISDTIETYDLQFTSDLKDYFHYLIETPLIEHQSSFGFPMVFIIDALDECSTSNASYTSRKKLLETLRLWSKFLKMFKLFVTSRPEKDIEEYLKDISYPIVLYTGEYVEPETSQDIQKFLSTHLQNVTTNDIKEFTRQAARLFIFAETVMQFVNGGPLEERVKMILSGKLEIGNIDKLYFTILEKNFDKS